MLYLVKLLDFHRPISHISRTASTFPIAAAVARFTLIHNGIENAHRMRILFGTDIFLGHFRNTKTKEYTIVVE